MTSSGFSALMALSEVRTQESTRTADSINAERRRKEEVRRRQQEEEDRKEREQQAKMLRHHLEEQKREKEKQLKREQEREAKLKEMERREEEQRQTLLYGPKKGRERTSRYPTSSAASRRASDDDDDEGDAGLALTREEKRERRLQLQFSQNATRRSGSSAGIYRAGRRLPGGALNSTARHSRTGSGSADGGSSVRERLTAMPNTLTKLNTVKRDTRTIDEIVRDRAKARENKTLEGEEAREFHDWFGTKSKAGITSKTSSPPSPTASGSSTPSLLPQRMGTISSASKSLSPRPTVSRTPSFSSSLSTPKNASKVSSHGAKFSRPAPLTNKLTAGMRAPTPTKRARSTPSSYDGSESDSEYDRRPSKRAAGASSGIQDEIWKIFGRDRSKYMSRTVMSDDEDMEADMTALEREELTSTQIARKEDLEAEEEERHREEEKRRRRKERDRSG